MTECGEDDALLTSIKMSCPFHAQAALSSCPPASRFSGPRVVAGTVYHVHEKKSLTSARHRNHFLARTDCNIVLPTELSPKMRIPKAKAQNADLLGSNTEAQPLVPASPLKKFPIVKNNFFQPFTFTNAYMNPGHFTMAPTSPRAVTFTKLT
jgi:hypothetical protein